MDRDRCDRPVQRPVTCLCPGSFIRLTCDLFLFGELHLVPPLEPLYLQSESGQGRRVGAALCQIIQRLLQAGADQLGQL